MRDLSGHPVVELGQTLTEEKIVYEFVPQAFYKHILQHGRSMLRVMKAIRSDSS